MARQRQVDYSLYLVTDRSYLQGKDLITAVGQAVAGGVTLVQLREKEASSREFYQLALALKEALKPHRIPLIINDRLDIALAVDADGLHLGQSDLPAKVARSLLGPGKLLGLSVSRPEELAEGLAAGVDYFGAGPVYATGTKGDAGEPIGPEGLRQLKEATTLPVVAIGGINAENLLEVRKTGVDGVAVVSALMAAPDIEAAARRMAQLWRKG
ncbi:MAG TPA: thiamine phosphate synthase [Clostridia bacterium]|nr:thiamine phosphate synthase [Clostridia bacterium]